MRPWHKQSGNSLDTSGQRVSSARLSLIEFDPVKNFCKWPFAFYDGHILSKLGKLPEDDQLMLVLFVFEDVSHEQ